MKMFICNSLPVDAPLRITSRYGERVLNGNKEFHYGIDMGRDKSKLVTAILAVRAGTVVKNYWNSVRGWVVIVKHEEGYETLYQHLREESTKNVGDKVVAGEPIGVMGSTGYSTGAHLHFELRYNGKPIDPTEHLEVIMDEKTEKLIRKMIQEEVKGIGSEVPSWAAESWEKAITKGITDGTRPDGSATRAEVVVLFDRAGVL